MKKHVSKLHKVTYWVTFFVNCAACIQGFVALYELPEAGKFFLMHVLWILAVSIGMSAYVRAPVYPAFGQRWLFFTGMVIIAGGLILMVFENYRSRSISDALADTVVLAISPGVCFVISSFAVSMWENKPQV